MPSKRVYTEQEIEWLKENYATTKNKYIMSKLNIGRTSLNRVALKYRLAKIEGYGSVFSKKIANDGRSRNRPTLEAIENSHAKQLERLKDDEYRIWWRERCREGMNKVLRAEKRRIMFGLEQKTKRKLTKAPRCKVKSRTDLRKLGYIVKRASNIAYYTDSTLRDSHIERLANKHGITIESYELRKN